MRLAFGVGDLDEIDVGETIGFFEHRSSDFNAVVPRKLTHDVDRRVVDRGKAFAELREDFVLDLLDQTDHHVVKNFNLLVGNAIGVHQEEIGHSPQNLGAAGIGAGAELCLKLVDQGGRMHCYCSIKMPPLGRALIPPILESSL